MLALPAMLATLHSSCEETVSHWFHAVDEIERLALILFYQIKVWLKAPYPHITRVKLCQVWINCLNLSGEVSPTTNKLCAEGKCIKIMWVWVLSLALWLLIRPLQDDCVWLFAEEFQDSTENPHLTLLPAITIDTIDLWRIFLYHHCDRAIPNSSP